MQPNQTIKEFTNEGKIIILSAGQLLQQIESLQEIAVNPYHRKRLRKQIYDLQAEFAAYLLGEETKIEAPYPRLLNQGIVRFNLKCSATREAFCIGTIVGAAVKEAEALL